MIETEIKNLTENLNTLKIKNGLTQKQLAEIGGVSVGTVRKLLSGELPKNLPVTPLLKIAKHFGFHISDLFNLKIS